MKPVPRIPKLPSSEGMDLAFTIHSFVTHPKDTFPKIFRMVTEQHLFYNQWVRMHWDHHVLQNIVDVMKRYELNDLQFHGKTVFICLMMLQHGFDPAQLPSDSSLLDDLVETLLRLLVQFPVYNNCFLLLDLLVQRYGMNIRRIFEIGCSLTDQLPVILNDDNYIAMLHFTAKHCNHCRDLQTLSLAIKFLAHVSGHIVGEFKSDFFLEKCYPMFQHILRLRPQPGESFVDKEEDHAMWYTMRLLRIIASVHPRSNGELAESPLLRDIMNIVTDASTTERCLRESLVLTNTFVGANPATKERLKKSFFSQDLFRTLSARRFASCYDMLIELFLTLYEADLPYDDKGMIYTLLEDSVHYQTLETILSDLTQIVQEDISRERTEEMLLDHPPALEFLARALDKLERSLRVISHPRYFVSMKMKILPILHQIFQTPNAVSIQDTAGMDIVILIFKGSCACWQSHAMDPLDNEFLNLSQRLVEDFFVHASNQKIFDQRDRNSLHYLAGSDNLSDIPDIVSSSVQSSSPHQFQMLSQKSFSFNSNITPQPQPLHSTSLRQITPSMRAAMNSSNLPQALQAVASSGNLAGMISSADSSQATDNDSPVPNHSRDVLPPYQIFLMEFRQLLSRLISSCSTVLPLAEHWEELSMTVRVKHIRYLYLLSHLLGWDTLQHFIPHVLSLQGLLVNFVVEDRFRMKSRIIRRNPHRRDRERGGAGEDETGDRVRTVSSSSSSGYNRNGNHPHPSGQSRPPSVASPPATYLLNPMFGLDKMIISILTGLTECLGSFDQAMAYSHFLTKVLTSKPLGLATDSSSSFSIGDEGSRGGGGGGGGGRGGRGGGMGGPGRGGDRRRSEGDYDDRDMDSLRNDLTDDPRGDLSLFLFLHSSPASGNASASASLPRLCLSYGHLDNMDLHSTAITSLCMLATHDRNVRRKLVTSITEIIQSLYYFAPVDPINFRPVLHLIHVLVEFIAKVEINAEEAVVSALIRTLRSPLAYHKAHTCALIHWVGLESPGFIYRGLSRLEVEDELVTLFTQQGISTHLSCPRLLLSALKAYGMLSHNANLKPTWLPLPWLYPWTAYTGGLRYRQLLSCAGLRLLIQVLQHAAVEYRLLIFTYTLSVASSLMYACVDGMLRPSNEEEVAMVRELKEMLISVILPWLPIAMDFIMLGKKKKKRAVGGRDEGTGGGAGLLPSAHASAHSRGNPASFYSTGEGDRGAGMGSPPRPALTSRAMSPPSTPARDLMRHGGSGSQTNATPSPLAALASLANTQHCSEHFLIEATDANDIMQPPFLFKLLLPPPEAENPASAADAGSTGIAAIGATTPPSSYFSSSSSAAIATASALSHAATLRPFPFPSPALPVLTPLSSSSAAGSSSAATSYYTSPAIEALTEKTMEALYAFLCTDDLIPLSTYLTYIRLFDQTPLIASVCYFMTENKLNAKILKRGIDFLRYFAENGMSLSVIATHAPHALLCAIVMLKDAVEVQTSFCKIVTLLARLPDDFASENLVRFKAHTVLIDIIKPPSGGSGDGGAQGTQHSSNSTSSLNASLTYYALRGINALACTETQVLHMTRHTALLDGLLHVLEVFSKDLVIQFEVLEILVTIDSFHPDMITQSSRKSTIFPAMRKARRSILTLKKTFPGSHGLGGGGGGGGAHHGGPGHSSSSGIPNDIDDQRFQEMLDQAIWKSVGCLIS